MESKKMGLQKFTEKKFEKLLENKLSDKVMDELSEDDHKNFLDHMKNKLNKLEGEEFDKFWEKIQPITGQSTKNQIYERKGFSKSFLLRCKRRHKGCKIIP